MSPTLRIHILGHLRLFYGEAPFQFASVPKALPLLAYLLLNRETPIPREMLAFKLWPDISESEALANLRRHLYQLRRALPGTSDENGWVLRQAGGVLRWNPQAAYWLDVAEFETLSSVSDQLEAAIEFYGGDLLPEVYEDWISFERERLRNQYLANLSQLIMRYRERGEYDRALSYTQKILNHDPWNEEMIREAILLRYVSGDRAGAAQTYESFKKRLLAELEVPPMPETERLYTAILHGDHLGIESGIRKPSPVIKPPGELPITPQGEDTPQALHSFPAQFTPFIGREKEIQQILNQLRNAQIRLLTLVGPGGIGKTRLGIEASRQLAQENHRFHDGIYFVSLASVTAPELLASAIINQLLSGASPRPTTPREQLLNFLRKKAALLVLDNLEHLRDGIDLLADILATAPEVAILGTSRETLALSAETRLTIAGLSYPPAEAAPDTYSHYEAVRLFEQSALKVTPGLVFSTEQYEAVAHICQLVQGMPLALEMAAAWTRLYDYQTIAAEIEQSFDFLVSPARDMPDRHRCIRSVFEHSWQLLSPGQQKVLMRLSVFPTSFSLDAALAVADVGALELATLLDKSLLQRASGRRFQIHELLRQFVVEQPTTAAGAAQTNKRHSVYYLRFASERATALMTYSQAQALFEIELELANIRQAWQWACVQGNVSAIAAAMEALFQYYQGRGRHHDGAMEFRFALEHCLKDQSERPVQITRAGLQARMGRLLILCGQNEEGLAAMQNSLEQLRELQDEAELLVALNLLAGSNVRYGESDEASPDAEEALHLARKLKDAYGTTKALYVSGMVAYNKGDYATARPLLEQALAQAEQIGAAQVIAMSLGNLGNILFNLGDPAGGQVYAERALHVCREIGYRSGELHALNILGHIAYNLGDFGQARQFYEKALILQKQVGDMRGQAIILVGLGNIMHEEGDFSAASAHHEQALSILREIGYRQGEAVCYNNLGNVACDQGDYINARAYFEASLKIKRELGDRNGEGTTLFNLAQVFVEVGEYEKARNLSQQGIDISREIGNPHGEAGGLTTLGYALLGLQEWSAAAQAFRQAFDLRRGLGQQHRATEPLAGLALVQLAMGELPVAMRHAEALLAHIESGEIDNSHYPLRAYLACYQVLRAAEDKRAFAVLEKAHVQLQKRAEKIPEAEIRRTFLENASAHRQILVLWREQAQGVQQASD